MAKDVKDVKQDIPDDVSKEEQIGIHKGALSTLANERKELSRLVDITEQLMQMHIKALKELGVDLEAQASQSEEKNQKTEKKIDDLL
ncbi:MAG: hypothetical protein ACLFP2_02030 [Candidatus Woesearchaeota archaeon]